MEKKAIIYDFDNTLYSVESIGDEIFAPLFKLVADSGEYEGRLEKIKEDLMGKPFQVVAADHGFSKELKQKGTDLLKGLTYKGEIEPYQDYGEIKKIPAERFLVTTGFLDLQWSKIRKMNIEADFNEIHVVDPSVSTKTKKDVFRDIMERKGYKTSEVLVVGDDPDSEIKAARELGIDSVLFDRNNKHTEHSSYKIANFKELLPIVKAVKNKV